MTVGVYPGSFDPFTVGHLDVLTERFRGGIGILLEQLGRHA